MAYKMRTKEEKDAIIAEIDKKVTEGTPLNLAVSQSGIFRSSYERWKLSTDHIRRTREESDALKQKWMESQATGISLQDFCKAENVSYGAMMYYLNGRSDRKKAANEKKHPKAPKVTIAARTIVPLQSGMEEELRMLRDENAQLKMMVAELSLDKRSLIAYAGR